MAAPIAPPDPSAPPCRSTRRKQSSRARDSTPPDAGPAKTKLPAAASPATCPRCAPPASKSHTENRPDPAGPFAGAFSIGSAKTFAREKENRQASQRRSDGVETQNHQRRRRGENAKHFEHARHNVRINRRHPRGRAGIAEERARESAALRDARRDSPRFIPERPMLRPRAELQRIQIRHHRQPQRQRHSYHPEKFAANPAIHVWHFAVCEMCNEGATPTPRASLSSRTLI